MRIYIAQDHVNNIHITDDVDTLGPDVKNFMEMHVDDPNEDNVLTIEVGDFFSEIVSMHSGYLSIGVSE